MFDENIVITHSDPKSPVSEAYRVLRTNIQYSGIDRQLKTIVVTSSVPIEGKTTTVVNMAVTFAQAGKRVLLIDSDMRKPKLHKVFVAPNTRGLTNLLAEHDDYKNYVRSTDILNLDILTCGTIPHNPSELLSSKTMKEFMETVSQDYDIIFMDAPPVGNVTDAAIISTFVDGTILVASSGHVKIGALKHAKEQLDKVNANILGVVLNQLDKKSGNNYYYYQYNYYGDDEKVRKKKKAKKRSLRTSEPDFVVIRDR
jgi:protein-tyrosine kinase